MAAGEGSMLGFTLGEFMVVTVLRLNDQSEWTGFGQLANGDQPWINMMELRVRRTSC